MISAALLLAATTASLDAPCSGLTNAAEVQRVLGSRVVEIMRMALDPAKNERLNELVSGIARIGMGHGDVMGPFGAGPDGIRKLIDFIRPARYHVPLLGPAPYAPFSACELLKPKVDFLNDRNREQFTVVFTFSNGRVIEASAYGAPYEAGSFP